MRIEYDDVGSEYSGEVSSWRSRDDSLDLLTTCNNSLDPLTSDGDLHETSSSASPLVTLDYIADVAMTSTPLVPRDPRRWTRDKLCQSFGLSSDLIIEVTGEESSTLGSLVNTEMTTPGCVSETVDSIEYFSPRYSPSTEAEASADDTVVMLLTSDDEASEDVMSEQDGDLSLVSSVTTFDTAELLSMLHLIHTEEENFDEEILR